MALGLVPGRSPSVATLHRVFKQRDVAAFEGAVGRWLEQRGVAPDEVLAVDGKTLRGIHGEQLPGVHLVSVYATRSSAVLAQVAAPGKGQELAATKVALAHTELAGRVVVGDALQTQREVCEQIVAAGGEYLLPVKDNQPTLRAELQLAFFPSVPGPAGGTGRPGGARAAGGTVAGAGSDADDGPGPATQGRPRTR